MPTTTDSPQVLPETLRQPPRQVRASSGPDFLSDAPVVTVRGKSAGDTMDGSASRPVKVPRVIRGSEPGTERFTLLQKWDGVVLEADDESFTARLLDSHGKLAPQQATFSRAELSPEEEKQITVGAAFVWTIGYRHIGATRHRDSSFYFRRLPPWNEDEIQAAKSRAANLSTAIGWK